MGLLDSLFGGSSESTTTTERSPWGPAETGLESIASLLKRSVRRPFSYYPDQTYAEQTEAERQAIQAYLDAAQMWGSSAVPAWQSMLSAPDMASNPYVTGMAEAIQSRVNRNLQENILPSIGVGQAMQGGFGTSGDVAAGIASRGTSDVLSEHLANLYGSAYGQGLQAQATALGMSPMIAGGAGSLYGTAGGLERAEEQRGIDEAMARFQFEQMEPYMRAQMGAGILLPMGSAFGSSTSTTETTSSPSLFQSLGGALGLGSSLFGGLGGGLFGGGMGGGFGFPGVSPGMTTGPYMPMPYSPGPMWGPYGMSGMRPY